MKAIKFPFLFLTLVLVCSPVFGQDFKERLQSHYEGKFVEVKIPLPDNKTPVIFFPQRKNVYDAPLYDLKIEKMGIGLEPGQIAMIEKVDVRMREYTFDLVGLGYDLPLGSIPRELISEKSWQLGSGRIRIVIDNAPDSFAEAVKKINEWLSPLISTRSLATAEDLPEEMRKAIDSGIVIAGMNHKAVYLTLGEPSEILRDLERGVLHEAWLYERPDLLTVMVVFRDGLVTLIKEF